MRNRKSLAPRLEPMESRELLAAAPFVGPLPAPSPTLTPAVVFPAIAPITGSIAGHYAETTSGATTSVALSGSGTLTPLGAVSLSGTVTNPGTGTGATGTITLSSASGKVTLSLVPYITGPYRPVGDPGPAIPEAYVYTVTSATGAYSGITGRGKVSLGIGAAPSGSDTIAFSTLPRIQPL